MNLNNTLSKFLVIPDTHFWNKNISSRKDYITECVENFNLLVSLTKDLKTKNPQYKIYLIFLGDIFHKAFNKDASVNTWMQRFLVLRSVCDGIFSVQGNHEQTFFKDNLFYELVYEIESEAVKRIGYEGKGFLPIIRVLDFIDIFNFRLHFKHYNCDLNNSLHVNNFLFGHEYWMNSQIFNSLTQLGSESLDRKYMVYNNIEENCILSHFNEVFLGHNHLLIADYKFEWEDVVKVHSTIVHFCGSLGLTNKNEVIYTPRNRDLNIITINDSNAYYVEKISFNLYGDANKILNFSKINEDVKNYKRKKMKKQLLKKYDLKNEDPIKLICEDLKDDLEALEMFENLENGGVPGWITNLI